MPPFKLGINMAGAVSAGAYTAGVLDFLTQALDDWYAQKKVDPTVPAHDVSIEVFSGASAGGMCAAISAILLQDEFEHITDTSQTGTTNRFYESWVNQIDIRRLLGTDDLTGDNPTVKSLLDCTVIDEIAESALKRGTPMNPPRPYVSPNLNIFLSLTNLRGVPYNLSGVAPGSVEESTFFYGDRIRFQTLRKDSGDSYPPAPLPSRILDLTQDPSAAAATVPWQTLQMAAKATGAFPVFLKPRVLDRLQDEYCPPGWERVASAEDGTPPAIKPNFPAAMTDMFPTVNVDGGVTNNDPFNYAHDFLLASVTKPIEKGHLPSDAETTDRAVLSVAPFPTTQSYPITTADPSNPANYNPDKSSSILAALPSLFSALISQSRFFGQSLSKLLGEGSFSNFIIAPSDDVLRSQFESNPSQMPPALQCATLSAFGGFFDRGFRAHDFALGRRNCQKFLLDHFLLPQTNEIIKSSLPTKPEDLEAYLTKYGRPDPRVSSAPGFDPATFIPLEERWVPIIPLCTDEIRKPVPAQDRFKMKEKDLDDILDLIFKRFHAVVSALLQPVHAPWHFVISSIVPTIAHFAGSGPLKELLVKELGDSYEK
jgi:predicted acylesterase/phospholipase RssA